MVLDTSMVAAFELAVDTEVVARIAPASEAKLEVAFDLTSAAEFMAWLMAAASKHYSLGANDSLVAIDSSS